MDRGSSKPFPSGTKSRSESSSSLSLQIISSPSPLPFLDSSSRSGSFSSRHDWERLRIVVIQRGYCGDCRDSERMPFKCQIFGCPKYFGQPKIFFEQTSYKTSQELQMLSRSPSDCLCLCLCPGQLKKTNKINNNSS